MRVTSRNNFPTGAGLASSASGFAALVRAAEAALDLDLSPRERSVVARIGSGSAARSVFGGFVEMHAGTAPDGNDSFAEPLLDAREWPLEVVIAVTAKGEKEIGSRTGMTRSAESSPYYSAWVAGQPPDLAAARAAIRARDFTALADVAEHNCLKMHAAALAARPPLVYWNGATVECLHTVRQLRAAGVPAFFTIDAGPQLKAVCQPGARAKGRNRASRRSPACSTCPRAALGAGCGAALSVDRRARSRARSSLSGSTRCSTVRLPWCSRWTAMSPPRSRRARDGACRLTTPPPIEPSSGGSRRARASGAALVDLVTATAPQLAFEATIDSQALYSGAAKLGLGFERRRAHGVGGCVHGVG